MLSRALAGPLLGLVLLMASSGSAAADDTGGSVECPPNRTVCVIVVTDPGAGGGGGTPGDSTPPASKHICYWPDTGEPMDCHGTFGWWSETDQCFYQKANPQPGRDDPAWKGNYPRGAIYEATCPGGGGTGGGTLWFENPPDGYGGTGPSARDLATRAVRLLPIEGPAIGMAPRPGSVGLVGLPVWMWTAVSPRTWGPVSATASVPGMSVTATAHAEKVVWDMGDGHTVTCRSPGTVYTLGRGGGKSPTCGYVYARPSGSRPGGAYVVTATTTWGIDWTGAGESGALTVTRSSTLDVRIGELQVLVT